MPLWVTRGGTSFFCGETVEEETLFVKHFQCDNRILSCYDLNKKIFHPKEQLGMIKGCSKIIAVILAMLLTI